LAAVLLSVLLSLVSPLPLVALLSAIPSLVVLPSVALLSVVPSLAVLPSVVPSSAQLLVRLGPCRPCLHCNHHHRHHHRPTLSEATLH
jgi:hypothetical protein